jgi:hypothetical protein
MAGPLKSGKPLGPRSTQYLRARPSSAAAEYLVAKGADVMLMPRVVGALKQGTLK